MKPRIRRLAGQWFCTTPGDRYSGVSGATPAIAYQGWLQVRNASERLFRHGVCGYIGADLDRLTTCPACRLPIR